MLPAQSSRCCSVMWSKSCEKTLERREKEILVMHARQVHGHNVVLSSWSAACLSVGPAKCESIREMFVCHGTWNCSLRSHRPRKDVQDVKVSQGLAFRQACCLLAVLKGKSGKAEAMTAH